MTQKVELWESIEGYRARLFDGANGERMYNPTTLIVNGLIKIHPSLSYICHTL